MWQRQLDAMPTHLHAVVSDVHSRHASLTEMAASLLQEREGELILCGASMGGMLAMEVVLTRQGRAKALRAVRHELQARSAGKDWH